MRILAIDDDPPTLELVSSVLASNGYPCLTAPGAEQALTLIGANPDILLAISDINMPSMDGIALLGRINSQCAPGFAPRVIFLTAHARVDYAVAALRLGAIDFLTKPVRPQNLLGVVRNAWDSALRARAASALPDEVAALARKAQELAAIVQRRAAARPYEVEPSPVRGAAIPGDSGITRSADVALLGMDRLRRMRRRRSIPSRATSAERVIPLSPGIAAPRTGDGSTSYGRAAARRWTIAASSCALRASAATSSGSAEAARARNALSQALRTTPSRFCGRTGLVRKSIAPRRSAATA